MASKAEMAQVAKIIAALFPSWQANEETLLQLERLFGRFPFPAIRDAIREHADNPDRRAGFDPRAVRAHLDERRIKREQAEQQRLLSAQIAKHGPLRQRPPEFGKIPKHEENRSNHTAGEAST